MPTVLIIQRSETGSNYYAQYGTTVYRATGLSLIKFET